MHCDAVVSRFSFASRERSIGLHRRGIADQQSAGGLRETPERLLDVTEGKERACKKSRAVVKLTKQHSRNVEHVVKGRGGGMSP